MIPHLKSDDRKGLIDSYLAIINDGEETPPSDIIKRDREKLRRILGRKK